MRRAIYPGSFDPVHNGHVDVLRRASRLFDEVIIAVAVNEEKQTLLSIDERIALLRESARELDNVRVVHLTGLLVNFARKQQAGVIIRGLRAISDFEFEFQMALMNRRIEPEIETVFLTPVEQFTYLSSRLVKEIAMLGGSIDPFVPASVARALHEKFRS